MFVDGEKVSDAESSYWERQIGIFAIEKVEEYRQKYNEAAEESTCSDCPDWVKGLMNPLYNSSEGSATLAYAPILVATTFDGPLPLADAIVAAVMATAATYDLSQRTYMTYVLSLGTLNYYGRTSGFGTQEQIFSRRFYSHRFSSAGVTPHIDKAIQGYPVGYWAIRGREQQLIDSAGCLGAPGVANLVRGVSRVNPLGYLYHWSSNIAFGNIAPYTGYGVEDIQRYFNH